MFVAFHSVEVRMRWMQLATLYIAIEDCDKNYLFAIGAYFLIKIFLNRWCLRLL